MTADQAVKSAFAGICAYEALAISTGRVPTVSALCNRKWKRQAAMVIVFLAHVNLMRTVAEAVEEAVEEAVAGAIAEMDG